LTRRIRQHSRGTAADVRPTTSRVLSALFSMFGPDGVLGLSVLDLYAGTGGFGLEALRRGADQVVMVEQNHRRCEALKSAVSERGHTATAKVICGDALRSLAGLEGQFDVVFADPPYADNPFVELAQKLDEYSIVPVGGTVMLEHFHKTVLPDELQGLVIKTRRRYGETAVSVYQRKTMSDSRTGEGA